MCFKTDCHSNVIIVEGYLLFSWIIKTLVIHILQEGLIWRA